jgi:homoisocitrate dehydrogenase
MQVCVIPGDGIGPEVIGAAVQVLRALLPEVRLVEMQAGWDCFQQTGTALPDDTLAAAHRADAVLFGAVASPSHPVEGYRSPIVALRRELDCYANLRPVRSLPAAARKVDLVVVRENTEGLYSGRERLENDGEVAIAERVISRRGSERIVKRALLLAAERSRLLQRPTRLTIVHKANVLRLSDGLFRETALALAAAHPEVGIEEMLVDVAAMRLADRPERFDVLVTTNLYGDILSDVASIHGGGLGLASSANLGDQRALFEPVHGAAPDIAGQGIANPVAAFGCVMLLLKHRGRPDTAEYLNRALDQLLRDGPHTPDLGGSATTAEVTSALLKLL